MEATTTGHSNKDQKHCQRHLKLGGNMPSTLQPNTKQPSDRRLLRHQVIGENNSAVQFAGGIKGRFVPSTETVIPSDAFTVHRFHHQTTYVVVNASVLAPGLTPRIRTLLPLEHLPYLSGIGHQF
jgi:hypothetical protein